MKKNCVFISGDFNTLHIGHIRLFKYAKELGYSEELVEEDFCEKKGIIPMQFTSLRSDC